MDVKSWQCRHHIPSSRLSWQINWLVVQSDCSDDTSIRIEALEECWAMQNAMFLVHQVRNKDCRALEAQRCRQLLWAASETQRSSEQALSSCFSDKQPTFARMNLCCSATHSHNIMPFSEYIEQNHPPWTELRHGYNPLAIERGGDYDSRLEDPSIRVPQQQQCRCRFLIRMTAYDSRDYLNRERYRPMLASFSHRGSGQLATDLMDGPKWAHGEFYTHSHLQQGNVYAIRQPLNRPDEPSRTASGSGILCLLNRVFSANAKARLPFSAAVSPYDRLQSIHHERTFSTISREPQLLYRTIAKKVRGW